MRCRNQHTCAIDGVAPGAEGEFPAANAAVQAMLASGQLVALDGAGEPDGERLPSRAEALAMVAELELRGARIAALEAENAQLKLDLEAATAPPSTRRKSAATAEG